VKKQKKRVSTDGQPFQWKTPFTALSHVTLPRDSSAKPVTTRTDATVPAQKGNRGRVDIIRQTAHRGGKTVTVVTGFIGISDKEKASLAKNMQRACGAGGTVKEGRIEIQGDHRDIAARILTEAGFRPVFAGG